MQKTRAENWELLKQHVTGEALLKHCLAVEIAMRAYAERFGEDVEYWGTVGLLHDIDFEKYPHEHPQHTGELLAGHGFDEQIVTDIHSHARDWPETRTLLQKNTACGRRNDRFCHCLRFGSAR